MTSYGDDDWVTIAGFYNPVDAHVMVGLLAEHDIEAVIGDEGTSNALPGYMYALGGVKVRVRTIDLERAQEVLNAPFE